MQRRHIFVVDLGLRLAFTVDPSACERGAAKALAASSKRAGNDAHCWLMPGASSDCVKLSPMMSPDMVHYCVTVHRRSVSLSRN
mmetsp:Transcript_2597/g.7057  ORF Transcript_2597/g.7057 Transcript_2597/m.7057 type:complete len:84 (+) Transcript_2597:287-538(+)